MNERSWWSGHVRAALHRPAERCIAEKVQDAFKKGAPDVDVLSRGNVLKLELKFTKALPHQNSKTPYDLGCTAEQRLWLEMWYQAGGRSAVMLGIGDGRALLVGWKHAREPMTIQQLLDAGTMLMWKGRWAWSPLAMIPMLLASGALDEACSLKAHSQDEPRDTRI